MKNRILEGQWKYLSYVLKEGGNPLLLEMGKAITKQATNKWMLDLRKKLGEKGVMGENIIKTNEEIRCSAQKTLGKRAPNPHQGGSPLWLNGLRRPIPLRFLDSRREFDSHPVQVLNFFRMRRLISQGSIEDGIDPSRYLWLNENTNKN